MSSQRVRPPPPPAARGKRQLMASVCARCTAPCRSPVSSVMQPSSMPPPRRMSRHAKLVVIEQTSPSASSTRAFMPAACRHAVCVGAPSRERRALSDTVEVTRSCGILGPFMDTIERYRVRAPSSLERGGVVNKCRSRPMHAHAPVLCEEITRSCGYPGILGWQLHCRPTGRRLAALTAPRPRKLPTARVRTATVASVDERLG